MLPSVIAMSSNLWYFLHHNGSGDRMPVGSRVVFGESSLGLTGKRQ